MTVNEDEEQRELSEDITAKLGMEPRLLRLLSAVHEAGHVIVAHTVGMTVTHVQVTSHETIGLGGDRTTIDFSTYGKSIIPISDLLAMRAAGFQASFMWMEGRGRDGNTDPYKFALNTLAGCDITWCEETCCGIGRSDLSMQDGMLGAGRVLKRRWRATLRLAYALASAGSLSEAELQPFLKVDMGQVWDAIGAYRRWIDETADQWKSRD